MKLVRKYSTVMSLRLTSHSDSNLMATFTLDSSSSASLLFTYWRVVSEISLDLSAVKQVITISASYTVSKNISYFIISDVCWNKKPALYDSENSEMKIVNVLKNPQMRPNLVSG